MISVQLVSLCLCLLTVARTGAMRRGCPCPPLICVPQRALLLAAMAAQALGADECDDPTVVCPTGQFCFDSDLASPNTYKCHCDHPEMSAVGGVCSVDECSATGCVQVFKSADTRGWLYETRHRAVEATTVDRCKMACRIDPSCAAFTHVANSASVEGECRMHEEAFAGKPALGGPVIISNAKEAVGTVSCGTGSPWFECRTADHYICTDADPSTIGDWVCECSPPAVGSPRTAARPTCNLNECLSDCPTCPNATCASRDQECRDPKQSVWRKDDWECHCRDGSGSAVQAPARCSVDECKASCATCANSTCTAAKQDCEEGSTSTLSDWVCTCRDPTKGKASVGSPATCVFDECSIDCSGCPPSVCSAAGRQTCRDPVHSVDGDWLCECVDGSSSAVAGPAECEPFNECTTDCPTCAGVTCSNAQQRCEDPSLNTTSNWECHCMAPATGSAVIDAAECILDECTAACATCAAGACDAPQAHWQFCIDRDPSATSLRDWFCRCIPAASGNDRMRAAATCDIAECSETCRTCANGTCGEQRCFDFKNDVAYDWQCNCKAPLEGSQVGGKATCTLDECTSNCLTCAQDTCTQNQQLCVDPDQNETAVGGWLCECIPPAIGDAVVAAPATCLVDECGAALCDATGAPGVPVSPCPLQTCTNAPGGQECNDPSEARGDWVCRCAAPLNELNATGKAALCVLDECTTTWCSTCARSTCTDAGQYCQDLDSGVTGDWVCRCYAPHSGIDMPMQPTACELDECLPACATPTCAGTTCSSVGQQCHDPDHSPHSLDDWYCICTPPAKADAGSRPAKCRLFECTETCPTCEEGLCRTADPKQHCSDPDHDAASLGDWVCLCPSGYVGSAGAQAVAVCAEATSTPPTPVPQTPAPSTHSPPTVAPPTTNPPTPSPSTAAPSTLIPSTSTPPTPSSPAPPAPPIAAPTATPPTSTPRTAMPPTVAPPIQSPPTQAPPTATPATEMPPTISPATPGPPTQAPPTATPATAMPPTISPATPGPPTQAPPTATPATEMPPTISPATPGPPTSTPTRGTVSPLTTAPSTPHPPSPAPITTAPETPQPSTPIPLTPGPPVLRPPASSAPALTAPRVRHRLSVPSDGELAGLTSDAVNQEGFQIKVRVAEGPRLRRAGPVEVFVVGPGAAVPARLEGGVVLRSSLGLAEAAHGVVGVPEVATATISADGADLVLVVTLRHAEYMVRAPKREELMIGLSRQLFVGAASGEVCNGVDTMSPSRNPCVFTAAVKGSPPRLKNQEKLEEGLAVSYVAMGAATAIIPAGNAGPQAGMMAMILRTMLCPNDMSRESLDLTLNPLHMEYGVAYASYNGAMVGTYVILSSMIVLSAIVAGATYCLLQRAPPLNGPVDPVIDRRYILLQARAGWLMVPFAFLYGGAAVGALTSMVYAHWHYQVCAVLLVITFVIGLPYYCYATARDCDQYSFTTPLEGGWVSRTFWGTEEWVADESVRGSRVWVALHRLVFDAFKPRYRYFMVWQLLMLLAVGALSAWHPTTEDQCLARGGTMLGLLALLFVVLLATRPYLAPYENFFEIVIVGLETAIIACIQAAMAAEYPSRHWGADLGAVLGEWCMWAIVAKFVIDIVIFVYDEYDEYKTSQRGSGRSGAALGFCAYLGCCICSAATRGYYQQLDAEEGDLSLHPLRRSQDGSVAGFNGSGSLVEMVEAPAPVLHSGRTATPMQHANLGVDGSAGFLVSGRSLVTASTQPLLTCQSDADPDDCGVFLVRGASRGPTQRLNHRDILRGLSRLGSSRTPKPPLSPIRSAAHHRSFPVSPSASFAIARGRGVRHMAGTPPASPTAVPAEPAAKHRLRLAGSPFTIQKAAAPETCII